MAERFTVGSVTGWPITPTAGKTPYRPAPVIWYVHDSAYCYAIVAQFNGRDQRPETRARALAARLNEEHTA